MNTYTQFVNIIIRWNKQDPIKKSEDYFILGGQDRITWNKNAKLSLWQSVKGVEGIPGYGM